MRRCSSPFSSLKQKVVLILLSAVLLSFSLLAADPPHNPLNDCLTCHMVHKSLGGPLTRDVNDNICMSCHKLGGSAQNKPFADGDQAVPWPGLPTGTNAGGTSHRWDSGIYGRVVALQTNSLGTVQASGVYTGAYAKTFTLTIATTGAAGAATFNWTATTPGGGSGTSTLSGTNVALNEGAAVTFRSTNSTAFQTGHRWQIYVRPDFSMPTDTNIVSRVTNGVFMCSTCHDQHSEAKPPFDSAVQPYTTNLAGAFIGTNRHFMRITNTAEQLCLECHAPRFVTNSSTGSHPVGVVLSAYTNSGFYRITTNLPLESATGKVRCETCHDLHYAAVTNTGALLRTNYLALCTECHVQADTVTPAAHFVSTNTALLWPGGQYGTAFPALTNFTVLRGSCHNCHQAHGWPNATNTALHYAKLQVDDEENVCFTCHDSDGPAVKNVRSSFTNTFHHLVSDSDPQRYPGRSVECQDCHNPHKAGIGVHTYTNTATATRNQVSACLRGVSGVAVNYSGMTNFQSVGLGRYTFIPKATGATDSLGATNEYQICFKCHTGYGFTSYTTNTANFTTGSTTVTGNGTDWTNGLIGRWIVRTNDTTAYVITNVVNTNSLVIRPAFTGANATTNYTIWSIPAGLTPVYNTGTAYFTNGLTTVRGSGTTWGVGMVGLWIVRTNDPAAAYKIIAVASTTSLTIYPAFTGTTTPAGTNYSIAGETDLAQEFSPFNRSGHPVVLGMNYYSNSTAVGTPSLRGLQATAMKAPWTNVGVQTMMCSDCHNTDNTNSIAAQGPHGSAAQYLLRGTNALNWPNVASSTAFTTSWCANCHTNNTGTLHSRGEHSGQMCYACHIVIPHGGKMSRLIGDRDTMPARFAWQNTLTTMQITAFRKTTATSYAKDASGNCSAACNTSSHPTLTGAGVIEHW